MLSADTGSSLGTKILSKISQTAHRIHVFIISLMTYTQIVNGNFEIDMESRFNVKSMIMELVNYYKDRCD